MSARRRSLFALVLVTVMACGGSVSPSGDEGDTGGGTDDSSGPGLDGTTSDTGGTTTDGGAKDGTIGSDAIGVDGITPGDAVPPPADGPAPGRISCGPGVTCDAASQECCVAFGGGGGSKCIAKGGACSGAALSCSSAASCPSGDVCCAGRDPSGAITSTCEPTKCSGTEQQICATDAECGPGGRCRDAIGGFRTCRSATFGDGGTGFDSAGFDSARPDTLPPG
jgi:hypothetical protein